MVVKGIWGEGLERVVTPERWDKFGQEGKGWVFFERGELFDVSKAFLAIGKHGIGLMSSCHSRQVDGTS